MKYLILFCFLFGCNSSQELNQAYDLCKRVCTDRSTPVICSIEKAFGNVTCTCRVAAKECPKPVDNK